MIYTISNLKIMYNILWIGGWLGRLPSESKGCGWGGLPSGRAVAISVKCTVMCWYVLMHICMFIDIDGLLPEKSKHYYPVEWVVVGASPTPSDLFQSMYLYIY